MAGKSVISLSQPNTVQPETDKGVSASLSVYNVFDKKYRDPSGAEITQRFVEQDGTSVRLKLTYTFNMLTNEKKYSSALIEDHTYMYGLLGLIISLFFFAVLSLPHYASADPPGRSEYEIKAAFL